MDAKKLVYLLRNRFRMTFGKPLTICDANVIADYNDWRHLGIERVLTELNKTQTQIHEFVRRAEFAAAYQRN